jgi:hypothetical protein
MQVASETRVLPEIVIPERAAVLTFDRMGQAPAFLLRWNFATSIPGAEAMVTG